MLHVHSIDRLARNLQDLLSIVTTLKEKEVTVTFHKEKLEFVGNGAAGKGDAFQELQLHIIAAVAQFERALILERQREGIAIAKKTGKYKNVGRKHILSDEQVGELRIKLANGAKVSVLAREYGVSRQTIYALPPPPNSIKGKKNGCTLDKTQLLFIIINKSWRSIMPSFQSFFLP